MPAKRTSTPSWLLPPPIRRLREHFREIRRLASETHQQMIDARQQTVEILAAQRTQMAEVETLARRQLSELSALATRIGELVEQSRLAPAQASVERARPAGVSQRRERPVTRRGQAIVLVYHRIAESTIDPFELAVPPDQFEQHLQILAALGKTITVPELSQRMASGRLTDVSFAVTFDDGYADNLYTAKPILERHGLPATVFTTTGYLEGKPFWWDELAQLILGDGGVRQQLILALGGARRSWDLVEAERGRVYRELWKLLQPLDDHRRREALATLSSQLGSRSPQADRSLTAEELSELASGGLVDVGAHTRTHPLLAGIRDEAAREEICGSKSWLEAYLERPVTAFSYPYGDYRARDVHIVRQSGFEIAFSTRAATVVAACDRLQVPRVTVGHWDAAELERTIAELLGGSQAATVGKQNHPDDGKIDAGDLRRLMPVSSDWGFDRGTPVDRYYIARFLEPRATAIRGRVLEMADPLYTSMFGGDQVTEGDVLDVLGGPGATYTCRLEDGDEIPADRFDCIICTQVLQYIYDVSGALRTLHRILKPGGSLLLTVPGITPAHEAEQYGDSWYWSFTESAITRLGREAFGAAAIETEVFGNVLAATACLYGLADSDLTQEELDYRDPDYTVIVGFQAVKPV